MNGEGAATVERNSRLPLTQIIDTIRQKLLTTILWAMILTQINSQDASEGALSDTILELMDSLVEPLDEQAIFNSISKTHRVVIVEQDRPFCGVGAEVCYRIQRNIFDELDAPVLRVSQEDVPMPYNERLEKAVLPNMDKLIAAVKKVCYA